MINKNNLSRLCTVMIRHGLPYQSFFLKILLVLIAALYLGSMIARARVVEEILFWLNLGHSEKVH